MMDRMLLKQLSLPLVLAFFVSIFVLVMQLLFVWVDELAGKGLSIYVIGELIFYMSFVFVPMALPISILLSTVMVYGGLAETYQLTSLKASGISLLRIMRSSIGLMLCVSIMSFVFSNYLIPEAQLKFRKRMYEIKSKKPALALETGVFNDDFAGYSIRIGSKARNGQDIKDILLYDMTDAGDRMNLIQAESGKMMMLEQRNIFLMYLYDGTVYQDFRHQSGSRSNANKPFVRTQFKEMRLAMDLSAFDLQESDEELFEDQRFMKNTMELHKEVDSIDADILRLDELVQKKLSFDNTLLFDPVREYDTVARSIVKNKVSYTVDYALPMDSCAIWAFEDSKREGIINAAISDVTAIRSEADVSIHQKYGLRVKKAKVLYELHSRYSLALACLVFLFIGAPMGTIVRKGGFGFPLLTAIVFFVTFIMTGIAFRKLSGALSMDPVWAAWMSVCIMIPIAAVVTYMAMNDTKISINLNIRTRIEKAKQWAGAIMNKKK